MDDLHTFLAQRKVLTSWQVVTYLSCYDPTKAPTVLNLCDGTAYWQSTASVYSLTPDSTHNSSFWSREKMR